MDLQAVLAALGDPVRFRIVEALRGAPRHVSDLVRLVGESQPNVSRHLKTLRDSGLVDRDREGKWVLYRLVPEALGLVADWAAGEKGTPRPARRAASDPSEETTAPPARERAIAPARPPSDPDAEAIITGRYR